MNSIDTPTKICKLVLHKSITPAIEGKTEVRVQMGSAIGVLKNE